MVKAKKNIFEISKLHLQNDNENLSIHCIFECNKTFWQQHAVLRETSIPPPPRKGKKIVLHSNYKTIIIAFGYVSVSNIYKNVAKSTVSLTFWHTFAYFLCILLI